MSFLDNNRAESDDHGEVFIDDSDIIQEINIDEEELPDADEQEQQGSDDEDIEEADDSMHTFTGHTGEVYAVACSPIDTTLVATGGGDDKGFMWRIGRGDWAYELQGHIDSVNSLAFSMDGQLLASGSFDGTVRVWDVASENLKFTLDGPGAGIEWVKWHPRGHVVLAGSEDKSVWMWNADKGSYLNMFTGHANTVTCGDFTPDGKTICTGSDDATLRIWNPKSGENIHVIEGHRYHTDGLTCLAISPDSSVILTGSKDNNVHMVNILTGKVIGSLTAHEHSVECVGFSLRVYVFKCWVGVLRCGSHFKEVGVVYEEVKHFLGKARRYTAVEGIHWSRAELLLIADGFRGPWAATGSMDQKLIVWDLQHSVPRNTFLHEGGVTCLAWLGTTRFIATGCVDGKVQVWDSLSDGENAVKTFSGHTDVIQALTISASGDFLVSVAVDGTARVFEIDEFK
ncbi:hypothetical protein KSS87_021446 [Heliosperma pusillum]|nr:hypothetical protein KSS87_021446 [Heliosperma pusillum]